MTDVNVGLRLDVDNHDGADGVHYFFFFFFASRSVLENEFVVRFLPREPE